MKQKLNMNQWCETKKIQKFLNVFFISIVLFTLTCPNFLWAQATHGNAELVKAFNQRTSVYSPETKVYHIQGNYQMIGNCNLTRAAGTPTASHQNNSTEMKFVDIDGDDNTVNSSSAQLKFSTERGANPECSRIVYAGLYWTGRKGTSSSSDGMTYTIEGAETNSYSNNSTFWNYTLTITTQQGAAQNGDWGPGSTSSSTSNGSWSPSSGYPRTRTQTETSTETQTSTGTRQTTYTYTFTPMGGGTPTIFTVIKTETRTRTRTRTQTRTRTDTQNARNGEHTYGNWSSWSNWSSWNTGSWSSYSTTGASVSYKVGTDGTSRTRNSSRSNNTVTLNSSYDLGGNTSILSFSIGNTPSVSIKHEGDDKILTKNIVKFKHEDGTYQEVTANTTDILYPSGQYNNIYVAYAEVTDLVCEYGEGNYYVADICTHEGSGGGVGYCGGWGMVVIYENSQMKWRDITLFDGYAQINGNSSESWVDIDISGFKSVQVGHVNMTLGMMAAEGDAASYGDYAKIKAVDGEYYFLNHDGQVTDHDYGEDNSGTTYNNFFNGETRNGGLARNPNYVNNMGVDLLMIPLENANNSIIANEQTSTSFRFGSKQEIYVPFCFVFGCDAYIPDAQAVDAVYENAAAVYDPANDIWVSHPGDTVTFTIKVHNYDLEDVRDALVSLPLPSTVEFYELGAEYSDGRTGEFYFNPLEGPNGTAHWTIDYLPAGYPDSAWATFKLHCYITTDCHVLASTSRDCLLELVVNGTLAGTSVINGVEFEHPFIQGFVQNGVCRGNSISGDLRVVIDRTDYVNRYCNCSNVEGEFSTECYENREVRFCSVDGKTVPFDEVASLYPAGTRFFLESDRSQEYTRESNFPQSAQNVAIVAVLPTNGDCESSLILVLTTETPTIDDPTLVNSPITYCLNETPSPLSESVIITNTAKTDWGAYVIFFKEDPGEDPVHSDKTAYNDITPNTSESGTTTYWVVQLASGPGAECYYSEPIELEVEVKSPFKITNEDGATTCTGAPVTFSADVAGGQYIIPDSVQRYFSVSGSTATLLGTAPAGTYTFEYQAPETLDDAGCPLAMTQQITHTLTPITNGGHVVPDDVPTICQGSPVPDFTIENMSGRVLRWEYRQRNSDNTWPSTWTTISNSTNTLTQASLPELTTGTYQFRAYVKSGECDPAYSDAATLTVSGQQAPDAPNSGLQFACVGSTVLLNNPTTPAGTYKWYTDEFGGTASENNRTFTMTEAWEQRYVSVVDNDSHCESQRTLVEARPYFSAGKISSTGEVRCTDDNYSTIGSITNAAPTTGATGTITYQWYVSVNGGTPTAISSSNSATFNPSSYMSGKADGTYVFTRTASFSNSSTSCSALQSVGSYTINKGKPDATINAPETTVLCGDGSIRLVLKAGISINYSYQWYKDDEEIDGATNYSYTVTEAGNYTVQVTDRRSECSAVSTTAIEITADEAGPSVPSDKSTDITGCSMSAIPTAYTTITALESGFGVNITDDNTADADLTLSYEDDTISSTCPFIVERTYTITDECGNASSFVETITIEDTTKPVITTIANQPATPVISCQYSIPDLTDVVRNASSDNCTRKADLLITQEPDTSELYDQKDYAQNINVTVTVTDECGNKQAKTVVVTIPAKVTASISSTTNINCYGGNTGAITVVASGGKTPYVYVLGATTYTTGVLENLAAGSYTILVADSNNCGTTVNATLTQPAAELTAEITSQTDINCYDDNTGAINLTVTGGTSGYTYSWSGPDSYTSTNKDITGLYAGTYNVTVTDSKGCETSNFATLSQPATRLSVNIASQTNIKCNGNSTGAIELTVTGGTGGYTYSWTGPNSYTSTSKDLTGLYAGEYEVTVEDANGCTATASTTLTQPAAELTAEITSQTNINCYGEHTGAIDLSVSGGTGTYSYLWNNGATTQDLNNLAAGTYNVTVTDQNNCTTTASTTLTEPAATLTASITSITNINCYGENTGEINLKVTGGTEEYSYSWTGPNSYTSDSEDLTGLYAGKYIVTVTDDNGCTATANTTLTQPTSALTITSFSNTDVLCHGQSTGVAKVNVTGGSPDYDYAWTGADEYAAATQEIKNLAAGTYDITVTDSKGCSVSGSTTISEPATSVAINSLTKTDISCNGETDGTITVAATGGTTASGTYTYTWNPTKPAAATISGLSKGTYSVTVTDDNGCTAVGAAEIKEPDLLEIAAEGTNVSCNGSANGAANITVTGGTTPYGYSWTWDTGSSTEEDLDELEGGSYYLTVTDKRGCTANKTVVIDEPDVLSVSLTPVPETCEGHDGQLTANAMGGTKYDLGGANPYYLYQWYKKNSSAEYEELTAYANMKMVTGLSSGDYKVVVKDLNGCEAEATLTLSLNNPLAINNTLNTAPEICSGGSFSIIPTNGTDGSVPTGTRYCWPKPIEPEGVSGTHACACDTGSLTIHDENITYTGEGSVNIPYIITAKYGNICENTTHVTVNVSATANGNMTIALPTYTFCPTDLTSDNEKTLTATLDNLTNNYNITWQFADDAEVTNTNVNKTVTEPTLNVSIPTDPCVGEYPYTVTVEDILHCKNSASGKVIVRIPDWNINADDGTQNVQCPSLATPPTPPTVVDGCGTPLEPVSVGFNPATAEPITCSATVTYTYRYTDCAGTSKDWNYTYNINDNVDPVLASCSDLNTELTSDDCEFIVPDFEDQVTVKVTENCTIAEYVQSPEAGSTITETTTVTVYVKDACGNESNHQTITLTVPEPVTLSEDLTAHSNVKCFDGDDGSITVVATKGKESYTYSLGTDENENGVFGGLSAGTYTVTVTDANGCTATTEVEVTEPELLTATVPAPEAICNGESKTISVTVEGGTAAYRYEWSDGTNTVGGNAASITVNPTETTTYYVTVTDANGCTAEDNKSLTVNQLADVTISGDDEICKGESTTLSIPTAPDGALIAWSTDESSPSITVSPESTTNYTVTVTTAEGCESTSANYTVTVDPLPTVAITTPTDLCPNQETYTVSATASEGTPDYTYAWTGATANTDASTANVSETATGNCNHTYSVSVEVTDANGCQATETTTFTVVDEIKPVITGTISPVTLTGCNESVVPDAVTTSAALAELLTGTGAGISDNCTTASALIVNSDDAVTDGCATTVVRTYTVTDLCGNTSNSVTQTFTINRDTPNIPDDVESPVSCAVDAVSPTISPVYDACGTELTRSLNPNNPVSTVHDGEGTITYNYTYTDCAGNTYPWKYVYTVTPNTFTAPTDVTVNVACKTSATTPAELPTITICGEPVSLGTPVTTDAVSSEGCGTYTYTYSYTVNGVPYTWSYIYNVSPTEFTISPEKVEKPIECAAAAVAPHTLSPSVMPTVTDACGRTLTYKSVSTPTTVTCEGTMDWVYTYEDCANNTATWTYSYILDRTTAPVVATGFENATNVDCIDDAVEPTSIPTATDVCGNTLEGELVGIEDAPDDNTCNFTRTYTYEYTDCSELTSTWSYVYTVNDNVDPTVTSLSDLSQTLTSDNCTFTVPDFVATVRSRASDNCTSKSNLTITQNPEAGEALSAGNTTVTITIADACGNDIVNTDIVLTVPGTFELTTPIAKTDVVCNGASTGTITPSVTGGKTPYTYTWSTGSYATSLTDLPAGDYSLTVVDANNCEVSADVTISEPATHVKITTINQTNVTCNGADDGTATVVAAQGVAASGTYTYEWASPLTSTSATVSNLAPGTYSVTVKDDNECEATGTVTITEPDELTISATGTNVSCNGGDNGGANLTVDGGTEPYKYTWKSGSTTVSTAASLTGVGAGTYTIDVEDANGCTASSSVTIAEPDVLTAGITPTSETCAGGDGKLAVTATGGTQFTLGGDSPYYLYKWYKNDSDNIANNVLEVNNLSAGDYSVVVTDNNGCEAFASVTLELDNPLDIHSMITATPELCSGGYFSVTPEDGTDGAVPEGTLYSWDAPVVAGVTGTHSGENESSIHDGPISFSGTGSVDIPYVVTAKLGDICENSTSVTVKVNATINGNMTISMEDIEVCPNVGTVDLSATLGGLTNAYDIKWTFNGSSTIQHNAVSVTNPTLNVTVPSSPCSITYPYTVEVEDELHCKNSYTADVIVRIPTWSITTSNGSATVQCPSDAVAPTTPVVTDGCDNTLTPVLTGFDPASVSSITCSGTVVYTYRYTACDNSYKDWTFTYTIEDTQVPTIGNISDLAQELTSTDCHFIVPDFKTDVKAASNDNCTANADLEYHQSPAAGSEITADTDVEVWVTDKCGNNSVKSKISLTLPDELTVSVAGTDDMTSICYGGNIDLTATAIDGKPDYSYSWSGSPITTATNIATINVNPTATTTYKVTVTDANGCTAEEEFPLTVNSIADATIDGDDEICKLASTTLEVTSAPEGSTYSWSTGDETSSITVTPNTTTTYYVTVTTPQGCVSNGEHKVVVNPLPTISLVNPGELCSNIGTQAITANVGAGTAPYSVEWDGDLFSTPETTSGITGSTTTMSVTIPTTPCNESYDISATITDSKGCTVAAAEDVITIKLENNITITGGTNHSTVQCAAAAIAPDELTPSVMPTVTDACGNNISSNYDLTTIPVDVDCEGTMKYVYTYTDCSSNTKTWEYTYTIDRTTVPVVNATGYETSSTVTCADLAIEPDDSSVPTATDVCGNTLTGTLVSTTNSSTSTCDFYRTYKYEYTDCSGLKNTWSYTYHVVDDVKPTITCPSNITTNTDEGKNYATVVIALPTISDNCNTYTYSHNSTYSTTGVGSINASGLYPVGTTTITYTVVDKCGNTNDCSFTVTVDDEQAPEITCPSTINVQCVDDVPDAYADYDEFVDDGGTATDNVAIDEASFRLVNTVATGSDCDKTIVRTYGIKDDSGLESTCDQTITVKDNVPPTFTSPLDGIVYRNADCTYVASPAVTGDVIDEADNCSIGLEATYTDFDITPSDACAGTIVIKRIWSLVDECGNAADDQEQIIEIVDNSAPVISGALNPIYVEGCSIVDKPAAATTIAELESMGITVTDGCTAKNDIQVTYSDGTASATCPYTFTRIYTLIDDCGNEATTPQIISIRNTAVPTITTALANIDLGCNPTEITAPSVSQYTVYDVCDGDAVVSLVEGVEQIINCVHSKVWTGTYTNACGTSAVPASITVTWVETEAPVIVSSPESTLENPGTDMGCNWDYVNNGPKASDFVLTSGDCAAAPIVTITSSITGDCQKTGVWTVSYANQCHQTDTVKIDYTWTDDSAAPEIDEIADQTAMSNGSCEYVMPDLEDVVMNAITESCSEATFVSQSVAAGTIYTQTETVQNIAVTVKVKDACDNEASTTVNVVVPAKPSLTIAPVDATCANNDGSVVVTTVDGTAPYTYEYAKRYDNTWSTANNTNTLMGLDTATYMVTMTDANGCEVTEEFVIDVDDDWNVTITPNTDEICSGSSFVITPSSTAAGITYYSWSAPTQSVAGAVTGVSASSTNETTIYGENLVNTASEPVTLTYTVVPTYGICEGTSQTVAVTVLPTGMATLDITLDNPTVCPDKGSIDLTAIFSDALSNATITWNFNNGSDEVHSNVTGSSDTYEVAVPSTSCDAVYTYTVEYSDGEGCTTTVNGTVTVAVANNITLTSMPTGSTVNCPSAATADAITLPEATDACGQAINSDNWTLITEPAAVSCEGTMAYTFRITDCAGNTKDWTYTYTIDRTTAPAQVGGPVATYDNVECLSDAVAPTLPVVKDVCGNTLDASEPVITDYITDDCIGTRTYEYTYKDCANLEYVWTFTYNITGPTTEPVVLPFENAQTVSCIDDAVVIFAPPAETSCGDVIEGTVIAVTDEPMTITCGMFGTRTYTYRYTDCKNNYTDWTYTYIIEPTFEMPAEDGSTVACASDVTTPELPEVRDYCGDLLMPTGLVVSEIPECSGVVTYTYTYTDCMGVTHDWVYTYTIEVEAPTLAVEGTWPADLTDYEICYRNANDFPSINDVKELYTTACGELSVDYEYSNNEGCEWTKTRIYTIDNGCASTTNTFSISGKNQDDMWIENSYETSVAPVVSNCVYRYPDLREDIRDLVRGSCEHITELAITQTPAPGTVITQTSVEQQLPVTVTVIDNCGYTVSTENIKVVVPATMTLAITSAGSNCVDEADGIINYTITNGSADYTATLSGAATATQIYSTAGNHFFKDLADGAYIVTIVDNNGCEVSENVTILQNATTLTIRANSKTWTFDGAAHTEPTYTVTYGSETHNGTSGSNVTLNNGDVLNVTISGSITDVGSEPNVVATGYTITRGGDDVTCQYSISTFNGQLNILSSDDLTLVCEDQIKEYDGTALSYTSTASVGDALIEYSTDGIAWGPTPPSITNVAESPLSVYVRATATGFDPVNCQYKLTITPKPIIITINDSKVYDGTELTTDYDDPNVTVEGLVPGDELTDGSFTTTDDNAGEYNNANNTSVITDPFETVNGIDNYDVTYVVEQIIDKRDITITADSDSKEYDGTPLTDGGYNITDGTLADGNVLTSVDVNGSQIEVGNSANTPSNAVIMNGGENVTPNYNISYEDGTLTVVDNNTAIVISSESNYWIYDGETHTEPTYIVTYGGTSITPDEGSDGLVFTLPTGDKITITPTGSITNKDTVNNTFTYEIENVDNYDNITINYGELGITCRPVTITAATSPYIYDGNVHTNPAYTVVGLVGEDAIVPTITGSIKYPSEGSVANVVGDYVFTGVDEDNYCITKVNGLLTMICTPVTLDITADSQDWTYDGNDHTQYSYTMSVNGGAAISVPVSAHGEYIFPNGDVLTVVIDGTAHNATTTPVTNAISSYSISNGLEDMSDCYTITPTNGALTISKRPIKITGDSEEWIYDGNSHRDSSYTVGGDGLVEGEVITHLNITGTITNPGTTPNVPSNAVIEDVHGNDVTDNYEITYVEGILEVTGNNAPITITSGDCHEVYNGEDQTCEVYTVTYDGTEITECSTCTPPAGTHQYIIPTTGDTITISDPIILHNVDTVPNKFDYTITNEGNYLTVDTTQGVFSVDKRPITITAGDSTKVFDGTPLTCDSSDLTSGTLATGDVLADTTVTGSQTAVGSGSNDVTGVVITNADGDTVTNNYEITVVPGVLTVTTDTNKIEITSGDCHVTYDAADHTCEDYTVTYGGDTIEECLPCTPDSTLHEYILPTGDTVVVTPHDTLRNVDTIPNKFDYTVTNPDNYEPIDTTEGDFSVDKRPITITAASAEKVFDSAPLTKDSCWISTGTLATGDIFADTTVTGSQTIVGTSPNVPSNAVIEDAHGNNVTDNYDITYVNGTLTVSAVLEIVSIDVTDVTCKGEDNGEVIVTITGGTPWLPNTYAYEVTGPTPSTGTTDNTLILTSLKPGDYSITVTDSMTRFATQTFTVSEPSELTASVVIPTDLCPNQGSYSVSVTTAGGNGGNHYVWSIDAVDADATMTTVAQVLTNDCDNEYSVKVVVTDAKGCEATATGIFKVVDESKPTFNTPKDTTLCRAADGTISAPTSTTGEATEVLDNCDAAPNVSWVDLDTTGTDFEIRTIHRQWTVTDSCGNDSVSVQNINILPSVAVPGAVDLTCANDTVVELCYGFADTLLHLTAPTVVSHLTGLTYTVTSSPADGYRFPVGTTVVTWSITDDNDCGNTITCTQNVTITLPPCGDSVSIDNYTYSSVRIGYQCWTGENMRHTHYADLSAVDPNGYGVHSDNPANDEKFGKLYTWYAAVGLTEGDDVTSVPVHSRGICPEGWAIPTADDYMTMISTSGGAAYARSTDAQYWIPSLVGVMPDSGVSFNARGAGYWDATTSSYVMLLYTTQFWTNDATAGSTSISVELGGACGVESMNASDNNWKFSVRCIKLCE